MTSSSKSCRVAINALTDTSVWFAAGTARIGFATDIGAGVLNTALGLISAGVRAGSESLQDTPAPQNPSLVRRFISNTGAAMNVSGAFLLCSAASVVQNGNLADEQTLRTLAFFVDAGICNISRGIALSYPENSTGRRIADSVTGVTSVLGSWLGAGPNVDPAIIVPFAIGGAVSLTQGFNQRFAKSTERYEIPNWLYVGGCGLVAASVKDPVFVSANLLYLTGFLSLIATRRFGGVSQAGEAAGAYLKQQGKGMVMAAAMQRELLFAPSNSHTHKP